MPLESGSSRAVIGANIATEIRAGHDPRQAAAIAYSNARGDGMDGEIMDAVTGLRSRLDAIASRLDSMEREGAAARVDARTRADAIDVSTNNYRFTHGKGPSGSGSWAFDFDGKTEFCPGQKSYGEAKAWAQKRAKEIGASRVAVAT